MRKLLAALFLVVSFAVPATAQISGPSFPPGIVEDNITAFAGGGQGSATQLAAGATFHRITTVASTGDSVKLPPATVGAAHYVAGTTASRFAVFPSTGESINAAANNATSATVGREGVWFVCITAGNWISTPIRFISTTDQVTVTVGTDGGLTFSTPQSINTTSAVQFGSLALNSKIALSATAPTIASGFGSSPSIPNNNGTAAFTINVGTGGTANSGVVTMPAATTGWLCSVAPTAAPQAGAIMDSQPTSATSITITNYTASTGVALAWTASAVIGVQCSGF